MTVGRDGKTDAAKPKRGWRFSLRTLLIVATLVCVVLAPIAEKINRYRTQRAFLVQFIADRGVVGFADGSTAISDDWWRFVFGEDLFHHVTTVYKSKGGTLPLASLPELPELRVLHWYCAKSSDLQGLPTLQNLEPLSLWGPAVSDLSLVAELKGLKTLGVSFSPVSDIGPLSELHNLQILDIKGTEVSDLTPMAGLVSLRKLYAVQTPVSDLTPLRGLSELEHVVLRDTDVADISPLGSLNKLNVVDLDGTAVTDLTPLKDFPGTKIIVTTKDGMTIPEEIAGRVRALR